MTLVNLKDYYQVLGVKTTASSIEIKKAYISLMRKCHPDLFPENKHALGQFQEITEAYNILGNIENRLKYALLLDKKRQMLKNERRRQKKLQESIQ